MVVINDNYVKCVNGILHKIEGLGICGYCQAKKEVFDDLEKAGIFRYAGNEYIEVKKQHLDSGGKDDN